ncbi:MAG TPA: hypothetical protein VM095_04965 [Pyrinomonadaceae bacterium]|nr:hypothetical protein [Pyrinomonadaceae bacterium]
MRKPTRIMVASLVLALMSAPALTVTATGKLSNEAAANEPQSVGALERGYRTGYSDGYQNGYKDSADNVARDYRNKDEYQRADRAYAASYGALEDYRDGYQQGFEAGYDTGYDRRGFNSTIPANLSRRGAVDSQSGGTSLPPSTGTSSSSGSNSGNSSISNGNGPVSTANVSYIPSDTMLRVELLTNLSTETTQRGDRFEARVVEPVDYQGATIEGHVTRVKRPGRIKGNSELQLTFDKISLNNRWTDFKAQVIEVIDSGQSDNVGDVDEEGGVKGKDKTKDDVAKIGSSAGVGAIIGAIFGGGKGAAIGAAIGAAVGTGGVLTSGGKDIHLDHGQHLRIRTSRETRF